MTVQADSWNGSTMARCYLSTERLGSELLPGDVITGFHREPVRVVVGVPMVHPTHGHLGWATVQEASPYGVGTYVYLPDSCASVGRVPLVNVETNGWNSPRWQAPCGCVVSDGAFCDECRTDAL